MLQCYDFVQVINSVGVNFLQAGHSHKKIVILTGNEIRHEFFRKSLSNNPLIDVITTYCEGDEKSLQNRTDQNKNSSQLERLHVSARTQTEKDFFSSFIDNAGDQSNPRFISKGDINSSSVVEEIVNSRADLIVCYGSSLIKSELLEIYKGRFLNVHLGLSPYYRGSGTNVWPLINGEPDMVGVTFMYIDSGIDTGEIIHQIRADIYLGDSPHSIGNRLIRKMTDVYAELVVEFEQLIPVEQPVDRGVLYFQKDFDQAACRRLYDNFSAGMIERYINSPPPLRYIAQNPGIAQ